MPKNIKEERYRWIKPIINKQITIKDLVEISPFSERTIKYWLSAFNKGGIVALTPKSTRPRSCSGETPIRLKEKILDLRKDENLSAIKIHWRLEKEGYFIHTRTIGKILKSENLTRKYRVRKIKYKYVRALFKPGELVEIDIKYVPDKIDGRRYYQFTAIDCASRWRYLKIYEEMNNKTALEFLNQVVTMAPFKTTAVKTDNGAYFTNRYTGYLKSTDPFNFRIHAFDILCRKLEIEHYLIDPGKPQQNGKVERSHRSDQESFYDRIKFNSVDELKYKLRLWNMYYNDLEHCGLNGLTPNEALALSEKCNMSMP